MLRSLRSSLARFAVRRAAACQRFAPKRAAFWLRLACGLTPVFADPYPALVRLRRATGERWGAVAAARGGRARFPGNPGGWGEAGGLGAGRRGWVWWYEGLRVPTRRPGVLKDAGLRERPSGRNRAELGLSVPYNTTFSRRITLYRLSVRRYSDTAYASRITAVTMYAATM